MTDQRDETSGSALATGFGGRSSVAPDTDPVDWARLQRLPLTDFVPRSTRIGTVTRVERPAHRVIDVHNHLGRWLTEDDSWMAPDVAALLRDMDALGVERVVNLDGRWGQELEANLDRYDRAHPDRFVTFCHLDWGLLGENPSAAPRLIANLEESHRAGARGVKIWKDLGLSVRDAADRFVLPDDPRVIAAVRRAGELAMPVLIHTADPVAFFDPVDEHNERLEELAGSPHWWFGDRARYPSFVELMESLAGLVRGAPGTSIIGAHVGCYAENLAWVSDLMDECSNFHVDLGGRLGELGRQPRAFAALVAAHPDRVLFGTDSFPPDPTAYHCLYRFLETDDESWPYTGSECEVPPQGRWAISSAAIPPEHLAAIYAGNARRLGL